MSNKPNCNHNPCLKGKIAAEYLNESEEVFRAASSCDSCLNELMSFEASLTLASMGNPVVHSDAAYNEFQEALDLNKAELLLNSASSPEIPEYLKKYMELSFSQNHEDAAESFIVKMTKNGIKFIDSIVENMAFVPMVNYAPVMRSAITETPESFIVLEEKLHSGVKVTYQIIQESLEDAFLSIKVESDDLDEFFVQANLKKEGRFIQSSRFNSDNIVSFSGLKEGKYNIELTSDKNSKKIDLIILVD